MLKMFSISFLKNSVLESRSIEFPRVSRETLNIDFYNRFKLYMDKTWSRLNLVINRLEHRVYVLVPLIDFGMSSAYISLP